MTRPAGNRLWVCVTALEDYLRARRAQVNAWLDDALQPEPGLPATLLEAMRYSLLAPGKRLRPLLALLAGEACPIAEHFRAGGPPTNLRPAACAVEMVHVYSLIHDDLPAMDDDDLRRGQPTCHRKFGEALAILAGDALLTRAFQLMAEGYPGAAGAACCLELARAAGAAGMVGGQVDDLAMEAGAGPRQLADLEHLHLRKTGALIRASLRLGALAAHAAIDHQVEAPRGKPARSLLEALDGYGRCLGLAFQITDDLLDVEGQAERAGKRVGKDAARNKLTYPGLLGVAQSRARAEALRREAREHLAPLAYQGDRLLELFDYVLKRDR
jgi:geranylgeranyl diphosphate synthase type II